MKSTHLSHSLRIAAVLLFLGITNVALAQTYETTERITHEHALSENGRDLVIEKQTLVPDKDHPDAPLHRLICLSAANPDKRQILMTYERGAEVSVSPDFRMIAVNDRPYRGFCRPRLFRREKDDSLHFNELTKGEDLNADAVKYFIATAAVPESFQAELLENTFVESIRWSSASDSLMIRIHLGYSAGSIFIEDWLCVYHIPSNSIGSDLAVFNQGAVLYRDDQSEESDR